MSTVDYVNILRTAGAKGFLGWESVVSTHE